MDTIIVREYKASDVADVCQLMMELQSHFESVDSFGESRAFTSIDEAKQYIDQGLKDISEMNGVCFVAESNGVVIGFVQGIIDTHVGQVMHILGHHPGKDGWIGLLIVTREFRNQGIGKELIKSMREYFAKNECKTMRLKVMSDNLSSVRVYEKLGFKQKEIEMVLPLDSK